MGIDCSIRALKYIRGCATAATIFNIFLQKVFKHVISAGWQQSQILSNFFKKSFQNYEILGAVLMTLHFTKGWGKETIFGTVMVVAYNLDRF